MPVTIPTTSETTAQNVTNFETKIGQTIPLNDKAFVRVLSAIEGGLATLHYKYAVDRILQNLALTASGENLDRIGNNYGVFRVAAVATIPEINQPAANGTSMPAGLAYVSDSNGLRYINNSTVVAAGGLGADLEVTCEFAGADGNLTAGDTLTISRQIVGIESTTADYVSTVVVGINRESDEVYRRRVLQEIRTVGGGGNGVDYRTWSEALAAVFRTFVFAGAPVTFTKKLKDGDMELADVNNWLVGNSATVTKDVVFKRSGTYGLGVARNAVNLPYTYQYSLMIGREYTFIGYGYSDGSAIPSIVDGTTVLWTGTTAASWQPINVTFTAVSTELRFATDATAGTDEAWFDDCTLEVLWSVPGDRTVYVETLATVEPDGIPTQIILDAVRVDLNTNPDTGKARMVLGTTDEKLFAEPIIRTEMDVEIAGLVVDATKLAALQASLDIATDQYFRTVAPYVTGVDSELDRNDVITGIKLSEIIQDTLNAYSASAEVITFNKVGDPVTTRYTVDENETAKLGTITYV